MATDPQEAAGIAEEMWKFINELKTDTELVTLIGAVGNWAAAFGTIAAVIFAIYLSRYPRSTKLRVEAGYALLTEGGSSIAEGFRLNIVNMSVQSVIINNIKLARSQGKSKRARWVFLSHWENARESGHDAEIVVKYHEDREWKSNVIRGLKLKDDKLLKTLHIQITTVTGYTKKVKLNKEFIDDIRHEIEMMEIERSKIESENS